MIAWLFLQGCPRSSPTPKDSTEKDDILFFMADTVKELEDQISEKLDIQGVHLGFGPHGKNEVDPEDKL